LKNINIENWHKYFPYTSPRSQQSNVINKVLKEFSEGKKYAIVDCGTGVGKSAIGLTIARSLIESSEFEGKFENGAYFLTTQKILQKQYEDDFTKSTGLVSLYSSSNYKCSIDKNSSCKEIQTGIRSKSMPKKYNSCSYDCCYKKLKKDFMEKSLGITNFSYFLTEKSFSQKIPNKRVLIIDEAHNLENELSRFVEISVSEYFAEKILKMKPDKSLKTQFQTFNWIKNIYYPQISKKIKSISSQMEKFGLTTQKLEEFSKITKRFDMLVSHEKKILNFISLYDKDNWVFDIEKTNDNYRKFVFKPIEVAEYANEYLLQYADYVIFMSATILSHEGFSLTLGLPYEKTVSIKESSPFDPKKSPIVYSPAGSMSMKNIERTLPAMTSMIKEIINNHKKEKGIIHTHNIRIAEHLKKHLRSKRILVAYGENRDKILEKHISSKEPTILLSPSMAEGVNLKGELSKFQILCKIPFPYLGDKVVNKKINKWKWWYDLQTIRTVIQSVGRSIRSEDDEAITYILDSDWSRVYSKNKIQMPKNFIESYIEV
jgi:Rad3-related DNA helicase